MTTHSKSSGVPFSCCGKSRPIKIECEADGSFVQGRASEASPIQVDGDYSSSQATPNCSVGRVCDRGVAPRIQRHSGC